MCLSVCVRESKGNAIKMLNFLTNRKRKCKKGYSKVWLTFNVLKLKTTKGICLRNKLLLQTQNPRNRNRWPEIKSKIIIMKNIENYKEKLLADKNYKI